MAGLLEGKNAFISGGTRGIGAALCEVFAREGANIAFNYHSRDDLAEEVKAKVEALGRKCMAFKVSVTDREWNESRCQRTARGMGVDRYPCQQRRRQ